MTSGQAQVRHVEHDGTVIAHHPVIDRAAVTELATQGQALALPRRRRYPRAMVHEISATELKARLDAGDFKEFYDVRTPGEYAIASIAGARLLDAELVAQIEALPRDTPLVFH